MKDIRSKAQKDLSHTVGFNLNKHRRSTNMSTSTETLIKKYETSAKTFETQGKKYWAYAKNGKGDEYYGKAKVAYKKAGINKNKAELLKKQVENSGPLSQLIKLYQRLPMVFLIKLVKKPGGCQVISNIPHPNEYQMSVKM